MMSRTGHIGEFLCRREAGRIVTTEELRQSLHPYLSEHAVAAFAADPSRHWVDIDGSLAFFDISGFTPLTERLATLGRAGAEHINDVLNAVFKGLIDVVFEFGGDVLEFGGDAMVVLYTGEQHERRAAVAAARMHRFMARKGHVATPAGKVRLGMSCGMAAGRQAYYLLGTTRRAFVVAGPVSTAMARLEARAGAGEVLVDACLAARLPNEWTDAPGEDGSVRLHLDRVTGAATRRATPAQRTGAVVDTTMLMPVQFREFADVGRRSGELKQVAMAFLRLDGTDDLLTAGGCDEVCRRLGDISDIIDLAAAELDVCWLETQAEANSVRWTVISGAPTATERDGERLLRVVRRVADASPLPLRIGSNLGVVFVGDMGHPERCTYIVMGDTTNLAARLMTRAEPGEIIAGERLVQACTGRFETVALEPFTVKGKRLPVRAALIGALAEHQSAMDDQAPVGSVGTAMVGRQRELSIMLEAIDSGAAIEIVGEAGVGKTRLWQEARHRRADRVWHEMRAELHELGAAYLPFRRLIRHSSGIEPHADEHTAGALLGGFVERTAPELLTALPLIADVVGAVVDSTDQVDALDPAFRADRLHSAVADLIARMTAPAAVVVVEDVHWLDEASQALLEVVIRTPAPHLGVVMTRRPGGWEPPAAVTIDLAPVDDAVAEQLLLHELPSSVASDATLARLKDSAAGNPLYLIELARAVAATPAADVYPESIERLLAARIDKLPVASRALIRDASVLGTTINRELAAKVLDRPDLADPSTWEKAFADLFVADDDCVRFRHDLVRVAAYEGLAVRRRRAVHERASDVIEAWGDAAPIADPVAALAFHATGSGIPSRIVTWNRRAAEAAIAKGAMEVAERLLGAVIPAERETRASPTSRRATYRQLAIAAERAGHPQAALDALVHASRLAAGDERAAITIDRVRLLEKLGRYRAALVTTARAVRSCTDPMVHGHLILARATIRNFLGEWNECLSLTLKLLDDPSLASDKRLVAQAHLLSEWCCMSLGLPDRVEHDRAAERLLLELDDSIGLANLYLNRGESAWRECRVSDAVADFRASSERYARAGDVVGAALADNNLAELLTLQFRLDQAEALLTRARRVTEAAGYPLGTMITISGLSRVAAWRGDTAEAFTLQTDALSGLRKLGADDLVADSLIRLVEIHVIAGDADAALVTADQAATALGGLGEVPIMLTTLARLRARALLLADRHDGARLEFARAHHAAQRDGSAYEVALAMIGLGRIDGDQQLVDAGMAQLAELGVLAPPPGT